MANWSTADLLRHQRTHAKQAREGTRMPQERSKYRNVKTVIGTEKFDSGREATYWQGLLARVQAGEVRNLQRQVPFDLMCPKLLGTHGLHGENLVVALYIADFVFDERQDVREDDDWIQVVADAKGHRTQMYALKKKWLELQEGIVIREV